MYTRPGPCARTVRAARVFRAARLVAAGAVTRDAPAAPARKERDVADAMFARARRGIWVPRWVVRLVKRVPRASPGAHARVVLAAGNALSAPLSGSGRTRSQPHDDRVDFLTELHTPRIGTSCLAKKPRAMLRLVAFWLAACVHDPDGPRGGAGRGPVRMPASRATANPSVVDEPAKT